MRDRLLGSLDAEAGATMGRLHVAAAALLADRDVPGMAEGGRVVLIGSRVAAGAAQRSQYAATKAALHCRTISLNRASTGADVIGYSTCGPIRRQP
jgi:NAD(P)-dependent dehydrogenase (short-subunit alcohol dehydrogenase family)